MYNQQQSHTFSKNIDQEVRNIIANEELRQQNSIELIASENMVSTEVLYATGSSMTNKYAEGYPGKRYYGGCHYIDQIENLAIDRASKLFNVKYVNVQPHSGSQANQAVFLALLEPGDKILSMSLEAGGHLTHGSKVNQSGKWFEIQHYGVNDSTHMLDYEEISRLAHEYKPKLIIAGASSYSRKIDFSRFRDIADSVGAFLLADISHYAGLISAGLYPDPIPYAHVVTSTTHKTLRGPRGAIIMTNDENMSKKINSAVFPGLQGGPLMHVIAAKAVAFGEALTEEFRIYSKNILDSAVTLAKQLEKRDYNIVTGGTDSHMILVDLRKNSITGAEAQLFLEKLNIICNKNAIPGDLTKATVTSGIRLGTPACVSRGFTKNEFTEVANIIADAIEIGKTEIPRFAARENNKYYDIIKDRISNICNKFPIIQRI